jgi:Diacylglycerol acyltransferase
VCSHLQTYTHTHIETHTDTHQPLPSPSLCAHSAPLFMAVGAPIPVPKVSPGDPGYADAVDAAHAALVDALVALYDKYKGQYGWQQRPLLVT